MMPKFLYWLLYGNNHRWVNPPPGDMRFCMNCERVEMTLYDENETPPKKVVVKLGNHKAGCYSPNGVDK